MCYDSHKSLASSDPLLIKGIRIPVSPVDRNVGCVDNAHTDGTATGKCTHAVHLSQVDTPKTIPS